MIAYFLASLREWRERRMRRTVCASAILLAAAALAGPLQPLLIALAAAAVFVVSGWAEGGSHKPAKDTGLDPIAFPARARSIVAGKSLACLFAWLTLILALSPILAASAIAWGLSGPTIAYCLLCWLAAYIGAASAGFFSKLFFPNQDGMVGLGLYLAWLFSSFYAAWLMPSNPFIQAWTTLRLGGGKALYAGICAEAAAAALLIAASALALRARKGKRDA